MSKDRESILQFANKDEYNGVPKEQIVDKFLEKVGDGKIKFDCEKQPPFAFFNQTNKDRHVQYRLYIDGKIERFYFNSEHKQWVLFE